MKNGNWVPISKAFLKHLPHDREYSKVEAILSIQCDYDEGNTVTVSGYADLWRWSRKKVRSFLDAIGVSIEYPNDTVKRQNQRGQIRVQIRDRSGTDKGQITFMDNSGLEAPKNRKGTDKGQIRDRSGNTTIENNTKNKTNTRDKEHELSHFDIFWAAYPKKKNKGDARNAWDVLKRNGGLPEIAILAAAVKEQKGTEDWKKQSGQFIPYPGSWLRAEGWQDEVMKPKRTYVSEVTQRSIDNVKNWGEDGNQTDA